MKRKGQREQLSSTEGTQKAQLSKRLVTIQTDVDLPPVRQATEPAALMLRSLHSQSDKLHNACTP